MTAHRPQAYSRNLSQYMRTHLISNVGNGLYDDKGDAQFGIRAPTVVTLETTSTVTNDEFNQTC
jgi:hypothetical protein